MVEQHLHGVEGIKEAQLGPSLNPVLIAIALFLVCTVACFAMLYLFWLGPPLVLVVCLFAALPLRRTKLFRTWSKRTVAKVFGSAWVSSYVVFLLLLGNSYEIGRGYLSPLLAGALIGFAVLFLIDLVATLSSMRIATRWRVSLMTGVVLVSGAATAHDLSVSPCGLSDEAKARRELTVSLLLALGADVDGRACKSPPITAGAGDLRIVQRLIAYGADVNRVEARRGESALHRCYSKDEAAIVAALVAAGADVNKSDKFGATPLKRAEQYHRDSLIAALKANGGVSR